MKESKYFFKSFWNVFFSSDSPFAPVYECLQYIRRNVQVHLVQPLSWLSNTRADTKLCLVIAVIAFSFLNFEKKMEKINFLFLALEMNSFSFRPILSFNALHKLIIFYENMRAIVRLHSTQYFRMKKFYIFNWISFRLLNWFYSTCFNSFWQQRNKWKEKQKNKLVFSCRRAIYLFHVRRATIEKVPFDSKCEQEIDKCK